MSAAARSVLLAFADDEHLIGQQHTEWIGVAPFLEEDLAFSSIAQDELGHAVLLYEQVLALDGQEATDEAVDALAFHREHTHFLSCAFVEFVTVDWAEALVRHWIYDCVEELRWQLFSESSIPDLVAIAQRALHEEAFHRRHADALLDALLAVPDARDRLATARDALLPLVPSLLHGPPLEAEAISQRVISAPLESLADVVESRLSERFGTSIHLATVGGPGRVERSAHFAPLIDRMREVFAVDPAAVW